MSVRRVFGIVLIAVGIVSLVHADVILNLLKGSFRITASTEANRFELRLEIGSRAGDHGCHTTTGREPAVAFTGMSLSDLRPDGSHIAAVLRSEAGMLACSGTVHDSSLVGDFSFEPDHGFVLRMGQLGMTSFSSHKRRAYTLFRINSTLVQSPQSEGIKGINSEDPIALKIFAVDPASVHSMTTLECPTPSTVDSDEGA